MKALTARILTLSTPLILSNLAVPLLGLIDSAILGHLSQAKFLAAAALGASLVNLIIASFNFLRMSTTGLSAQAFGALQQHQQSKVLQQSLLLAFLLGAVISLCSPILIHWGLSVMLPADNSDLYALSREYCHIRLLSAPASLALYAIIGWAIGQQNTQLALLCLLSSCVINIALDYLFIMQWQWQTAGSAWASFCAEVLSLLFALTYLCKRYPWLFQHIHRRHLTLQSLTPLLHLNRDLFVRSSCLLFVFAFFNSQSAYLGEITLAANAILLQCVLFQSYILDGFAHAAEALIGQAKGAKKTHFQPIYKATVTCTALAAGLLTLTFLLSKPYLAHLFTEQQALTQQINEALTWVIILPLISCWAYWLDGVAVGLNDSKAMRNSLLAACFGIFLPLWFLTQTWGNHGLWLSFFVFSAARGLLLLPTLKKQHPC